MEHIYQTKDPSFVVIDEISGYLITMIFLPFQVKYVLIAFFVFRIMDIIKPFPARRLELLKGGIGVMIDDIIAGVYAGLFCRITILLTGI